jgi:glyoxylase-like metal-dependent hydrolase (beta-lactamase superfamily II)
LAAVAMMSCSMAQLCAAAPSSAPMKLWRLDCGELYFRDLNNLSDSFAFTGKSKTLSNGCYLIDHGGTYMLWDTGLGAELVDKPMVTPDFRFSVRETLPTQLAKLGLKPEDIGIVAVSHMHSDHTGQAALFPKAKMLIGKQDLDLLRQDAAGVASASMMHDAGRLSPWLTGGAPVEAIVGDKDVFGDGSVMMLSTPGHTPGHHVLLVRMPKSGTYLMTGDLIHFAGQLPTNELTPFNTSRAETLASQKRVHEIVKNLKATLIIQHEPADIAKLPLFPKAAE